MNNKVEEHKQEDAVNDGRGCRNQVDKSQEASRGSAERASWWRAKGISMIKIWILCLAFLLWMVCPSSARHPMAGTYNVRGWNPGVSTEGTPTYQGTVTVQEKGSSLLVRWDIPGAPAQGVGVADMEAGGLSVGFLDDSGGLGAAYYSSGDERGMWGIWSVDGRLGYEVWARGSSFTPREYPQPEAAIQKLFAGTYSSKGWNPDVSTSGKPSYTGTLTLRDLGKAFEVKWDVTNSSARGIGILDIKSSLLTIGYTDRTGGVGVAQYRVGRPDVDHYRNGYNAKDTILDGVWSTGRGGLGHECANKRK